MEETEGTSCPAPGQEVADVSFEEARNAYADRKFWVSFFVRPCCPPPKSTLAKKQLDAQRDLVRTRADFTDSQKAELISLIDDGEAWYRSTPYWSKGN